MPNVKSTDITETIPCIRDELEWKVRLNAFSDTAHFRWRADDGPMKR